MSSSGLVWNFCFELFYYEYINVKVSLLFNFTFIKAVLSFIIFEKLCVVRPSLTTGFHIYLYIYIYTHLKFSGPRRALCSIGEGPSGYRNPQLYPNFMSKAHGFFPPKKAGIFHSESSLTMEK